MSLRTVLKVRLVNYRQSVEVVHEVSKRVRIISLNLVFFEV